jgi:hypothetical protein
VVVIAAFEAPNTVVALIKESAKGFIIESQNYLDWRINGIQIKGVVQDSILLNNLPKIHESLLSHMPIFSRHHQELFFLDLSLRDIALKIISLADQLQKARVTAVIMGTAASHHLTTVMLEHACRINGIAMIYEPIIPGTDYVLPMIRQSPNYEKQIFPLTFTDRPLPKQLENLLNKSWTPLKLLQGDLERSPWTRKVVRNLKIIQIFMHEIKSSLLSSRSPEILLNKFSAKTYFNLARVQKQALSLLDQYIEEDSKLVNQIMFDAKGGAIVPVIVAHLQPEATTFPDGGKYHNYIDIVAQLRSLGIASPILYKEHPVTRLDIVRGRLSTVGVARSVNYYRSLRDLGCFFVSDDFDLIQDENFIPITITGSIALERSLQNKNTVCLSEGWFGRPPGILPFEALLDLDNLEVRRNTPPNLAADYLKKRMEKRVFSKKPIFQGFEYSEGELMEWEQDYGAFLKAIDKLFKY